MSQCVPSWELDDPPPFAPPPHQLLLHHDHQKQQQKLLNSHAAVPTSSPADYEMAELTWKDGSLAMLGLRQPPRVGKPVPRYPSSAAATDAGGTLECIVDQARLCHPSFSPDLQVSLLGGAHHAAADATVPCTRQREEAGVRKRARIGDVGGGKNYASQGSAAPTLRKNGESTLVTLDTCELTAGGGGTDELDISTTPSASPTSAGDQAEVSGGSPETGNGSFGGGRPSAVDDHDSVSHSLASQRDGLGEKGGTSISTKRSRAAVVHNQSERKRRDRINQKMKILQRLLPNSSKTDKASMLDEAIEYLKLLQAQVQMMSRMSPISPMMLPIATMQQQQLQMSMMAHMAQMAQIAQMSQMSQMGMGLGIMDPSQAGLALTPPPIIHPAAFLPLPTTAGALDASAVEWMQQPGRRALPDMFSALMGCPTQQPMMSSEAYNRMAALYQQLYYQPLGSNQKT